MSDNGDKLSGKLNQFKSLSEIDRGLVGRLVQDRTSRGRGAAITAPDLAPIRNVFNRTLRDTADIRNIFQVMPDLHLPREILVSAIVSPGDLTQTSLIFSNELQVDSAILTPLTQVLEAFFLGERKLETKVPEWVDDALIWSGAHPILILPEAVIDRMINGADSASMESVASYGGEWAHGWFRPKGFFGIRVPTTESQTYVSFESAKGRINNDGMLDYHTIRGEIGKKSYTLPFRVTDNLASLRMPAVQAIKRERAMETAFGVPALESRRRQRVADKVNKVEGGKAPSSSDVYQRYFKAPRGLGRSRLEVVPTLSQVGGPNNGHPLEYHLSTEAVMPIHVPGDESNHVGYIILLDSNSFPVSFSRRMNYYDDVRKGGTGLGAGGSSSASGEILHMAKEVLSGSIADASSYELDRLAALHGEFIENDIVARLKSGMMGGDFELGRTDHIDRLMLARSLKNQMTTLLYVPAEMMIYMAYEYNEYGVGKSILEDAKALAAMRAAVTMANVIGSTKNAIPGKDINIELDPDDGDPVGSATFMANEALGLAYHTFPMALTSAAGLAEQLQLGAFSVNVTGNPRMPDIKTSITPRESSQVVIDTELQQQLRSDLTRVFSLTPEMVDGVNQPEFAVTAVQNNLMLMKRVLLLQGKTNPMITDYVRIFTYNSGILVNKLLDIIDQNVKHLPKEYKEDPESFLEVFLSNLQVKLPAPESDNLSKQLELYKNFSESLDNVLPAYLREEYFDGYADDVVKDSLPTVVSAWKGVILRDWMRKRGILRELDIFSLASDGTPLMDLAGEMSNHVDSVMKSIGEYTKKVAKDAKLRKSVMEAVKTAVDGASTSPEGDSGGSDDMSLTDAPERPDVNLDDTGDPDDMGGADAGLDGLEDTEPKPEDDVSLDEPDEPTEV